ncbi:hypothetical protein RDI58_000625 [Solanum bulbocastanum]|uniref:Ran guanine nucleotide release factor n=1 Tax=Solanum bulbocastanum TaxID=147425 RepID=A0AAN8UBA6_SOLBU
MLLTASEDHSIVDCQAYLIVVSLGCGSVFYPVSVELDEPYWCEFSCTTQITEQSAVFEFPGLCYRNMPTVIIIAVGQMAVAKGRQGREAQNLVKVYLANIRLKEVGTDVLITAYEPLVINPLSESATSVGVGMAVPAAQSGVMPMAEVFKLAVSNFKVHN